MSGTTRCLRASHLGYLFKGAIRFLKGPSPSKFASLPLISMVTQLLEILSDASTLRRAPCRQHTLRNCHDGHPHWYYI